nr:immunoglobulin heavy chain junction region [Macaca mulatta]MOV47639.1 immunoglobulin heavy chain junction region [Macaca mulatta]MOV48093.1 immunoglobulin heavy chain junction region [Macaca mulatta]MOV48118.1 immunoglobulin heavy chain junction region [Macaca mulatta]
CARDMGYTVYFDSW